MPSPRTLSSRRTAAALTALVALGTAFACVPELVPKDETVTTSSGTSGGPTSGSGGDAASAVGSGGDASSTASAGTAGGGSGAGGSGDGGGNGSGGGSSGACFAMKATTEAARISMPASGTGLGKADYTVELWVKPHNEFMTSGDGAPIFVTNEAYGVNSVTCRFSVSEKRVYCSAYDGGAGNPYVYSSALPLGKWSHIAYVRASGQHSMFTNGTLSESGVNATPLVPTSNLAFGEPSGYPQQSAAPVVYGASRFSKVARYSASFVPQRDWKVDADTVAQWLVTKPFDGMTLLDEAGGDNNGQHYGGFLAATCD